MRKFLERHEDSWTAILLLLTFYGWVFVLGVLVLLNIPFWYVFVYTGILIACFAWFIFLTKDLEWICPRCGFQPPWLNGAEFKYQHKEKKCERCGTGMTAMTKTKIKTLTEIHSHDGLWLMLNFSPFDPEYNKEQK